MRSCAGLALLVAAAATCSRGHREAAPEAAARDYLAGLGQRYTPKELAETTALVLKDLPVTDDGLAHLQRLGKLRFLSLEGSRVTDAGVARFLEFPRLDVLDLARDQITDAALEHLGKLTRLRGLGLAG